MKLAKVVGTVVSTIKSPIFEGRALLLVDLLEPDGREAGGYLIALLLVDLLEPDGREAGGYLIALDTVGAGAGETVLILDEGTSARQIIGAAYGPLRTVVVGIVDAVEGPASVRASPPTRQAAVPPPTAPRRGRARAPGTTRRS